MVQRLLLQRTARKERPTSGLQWGIDGNLAVPRLTVYHPGFPFAYGSCEHSWWYISRSRHLHASPRSYAPNERKREFVFLLQAFFPASIVRGELAYHRGTRSAVTWYSQLCSGVVDVAVILQTSVWGRRGVKIMYISNRELCSFCLPHVRAGGN